MAWYLFWRGSHILLTLFLDDGCKLNLSSSQNSPVLLALPILPAWLLANQCFIKIQLTEYRPLSPSNCLSVRMFFKPRICFLEFQPAFLIATSGFKPKTALLVYSFRCRWPYMVVHSSPKVEDLLLAKDAQETVLISPRGIPVLPQKFPEPRVISVLKDDPIPQQLRHFGV